MYNENKDPLREVNIYIKENGVGNTAVWTFFTVSGPFGSSINNGNTKIETMILLYG